MGTKNFILDDVFCRGRPLEASSMEPSIDDTVLELSRASRKWNGNFQRKLDWIPIIRRFWKVGLK